MARAYHGHALDSDSAWMKGIIVAIQVVTTVTTSLFFGVVVAAWLLGY